MGLENKETLKIILLVVITFENVLPCHGRYKPVGRIKSYEQTSTNSEKSNWANEFDNKWKDSIYPAMNTSAYNDLEVMIKLILEAVTNNEQYLQKISMEFKKSDLEFNISETMSKHFEEIKTQLHQQHFQGEDIIVRLKKLTMEMSQVIDIIKTVNPIQGSLTNFNQQCESKLTKIEYVLKIITRSIDEILSSTIGDKNNKNPRNIRKTHSKREKFSQDNQSEFIYELKRALRERTTKCDCKSVRTYESFPGDCFEILNLGFNVTGIYRIRPEDFDPFYALCDMDTVGGGWTVFQNRFDGSQDFYKPWNEYKHGFGNWAGEYWLGLEKLHYLTNQKLYELRIEMESHTGEQAFAAYTVFNIGSEVEGYRISAIGSCYGNASYRNTDSLTYHSGQKFSTYDMDNDDWKDGNCAEEHGGAWWYKECDKSNLNGKYHISTNDETRWQAIYWNTFKGPTNYLRKTKMMLRPLPVSHTETSGGSLSKAPATSTYVDLTRRNNQRLLPHSLQGKQMNSIPFVPWDEPEDDPIDGRM